MDVGLTEDELPVFVIVILPDPFVILIPDPDVSVERDSPVPFPISKAPFAAVDVFIPVPPFVVDTGTDRDTLVVPPKDTAPPPVNPVPVLTVTEDDMRLELGMFDKVFNEASIVLFDKVCATSVPTKVVLESGTFRVLLAV